DKVYQFSLDKIYFYSKYLNETLLFEEVQSIFEKIRMQKISRDEALEVIARMDFKISLGISDYLKSPFDSKVSSEYYQKYDTLIKVEEDFIDTLQKSICHYKDKVFEKKDPVVRQTIIYVHQNFTEAIGLKTC